MDENKDQFKPDFIADFNKRFERFKEELVFWADSRYKHYFDGRHDPIDYNIVKHRLWNYISPQTSRNGGRLIAVLFLKKGSNLPSEIVGFFDNILSKHFPGNERNPLMNTYFV